jgi:hypothetical protein
MTFNPFPLRDPPPPLLSPLVVNSEICSVCHSCTPTLILEQWSELFCPLIETLISILMTLDFSAWHFIARADELQVHIGLPYVLLWWWFYSCNELTCSSSSHNINHRISASHDVSRYHLLAVNRFGFARCVEIVNMLLCPNAICSLSYFLCHAPSFLEVK